MKRHLVACLIFVGAILAPVTAAPTQPMAAADAAFQRGDFATAQAAYQQAAVQDATNFRAVVRLGYLALLSNHIDEAQRRLEASQKLEPSSRIPTALLAEADVRRDHFDQAVPLFRAIGANPEADQKASFAGQKPYAIISTAKSATLRFDVTDPLPVVQVRINGSPPANFFIDTGASELTLDSDFAKEQGAQEFGADLGTFAGGKQALIHQGRVDTVTLGEMTLKNVPVVTMPVRPLSPIFGGMRVDGIIGTVLLYHFLATLDYPHGQLVLQPRNKAGEAMPQAKASGVITVPFWMAGDHFMVAHGTLNGGSPRLFFVDTGLAGGGFSAQQTTLTEAGIKLDPSQAGEGFGGGGKVSVIPFEVETLTLGAATQHHVRGLYNGAFPFEDAFGFHLSGLISHAFFRPYALTLDFTNMQYYLKPSEL